MPSTIPLSRSINYASQFIKNAPLQLPVGVGVDPAFTNADWVRQFILSPPFAWRWNRLLVPPILTIPNQTDYVVSVPTFGWIEKAVIQLPIQSGGIGMSKELKTYLLIGQTVLTSEPEACSAVADDGNGNITFRLSPAPDQAYTLHIIAQNSAATFGSINDTWFPLPDYLSYLYNQGMVAKAFAYNSDPRSLFETQTFLRQLVAANDGLTETQVNIFLADRLNTIREQQSVVGNTQFNRLGLGPQ